MDLGYIYSWVLSLNQGAPAEADQAQAYIKAVWSTSLLSSLWLACVQSLQPEFAQCLLQGLACQAHFDRLSAGPHSILLTTCVVTVCLESWVLGPCPAQRKETVDPSMCCCFLSLIALQLVVLPKKTWSPATIWGLSSRRSVCQGSTALTEVTHCGVSS